NSGSDYATVKYDTNGNQLWAARYNGPGNDSDSATSIALDSSGNVYVTGGSSGSGTDSDYATIKYDTNGNQLWVARYNGSGNYYVDKATSIALDAQGNVYVTGYSGWSYGPSHDYDYATIKYDTNGSQLWLARYDSSARSDGVAAIALDVQGNVYVTGDSGYNYRVGTDSDYATIKYDTNGNQLWAARYDGLGNYHDDANAIVLDVQGNIYVTGWSYGIGTDSDYATVKYDTNGNQLWAARYNGPGNDSDSAYAIALDVQGNVYVTGYSSGIGTDDDYAMIKYDTNGNQLWTARYNGPGNSDDRAYAIALDASGNIYVTGQSDGINTGFDYATIKYSQSGGVITGKVTIQNRTDHSELITFELRNPGEATALETYQVLTSSDGSYTLITVPAGTYDLTAKSSNTLRAKNENIIVVDDETTIDIDFALLGGDANDDNSVGLSDRFILMKSWNTNIGDVDWDERADFNNDNSIGLSDRFIFRSNWNTSGVE
ncbi:MAG: SBBP repeat-containing protein, partial [Candidatus Omnitrophica bacterium]|nr:SBBP repeat-containing protein [Candidatus Omnitrophota bacterium]